MTVQHILLDCPQLAATRLAYFSVATLKNLIVFIKDIHFIKDIQLYNRMQIMC